MLFPVVGCPTASCLSPAPEYIQCDAPDRLQQIQQNMVVRPQWIVGANGLQLYLELFIKQVVVNGVYLDSNVTFHDEATVDGASLDWLVPYLHRTELACTPDADASHVQVHIPVFCQGRIVLNLALDVSGDATTTAPIPFDWID